MYRDPADLIGMPSSIARLLRYGHACVRGRGRRACARDHGRDRDCDRGCHAYEWKRMRRMLVLAVLRWKMRGPRIW